jgi:DNA polymerase (family 10)
MRNQEVAEILHEIADILELQGVKFKPQAYRKAAQSIESLEEPIETIKDFDSIPGVGEAIARKITEILETGKLEYLAKIKKEIPEGMGQLMRLPEIGPKTAKFLASQGITTVEELEKAVEDHSLQKMKGFGPKTEENLKRALQLYKFQKERRLLGRILPLCRALEKALQPFCDTVVIAGSVRRWKETAGNIDVLAISCTPEEIIETFTELPFVEQVLLKGDTKSTIILRGGIQSDLRVVLKESYGSALQYFTGSKEHNIKIRKRALKKGFKLNEYGLFDRKSGKRVAGESEEDIYHHLGLLYIPSELREDQGEIEAAQSALPDLVDMNLIKGDFHVHTQWSDGKDSIEAMVSGARELHYAYIGICDHSVSSRIAHGLSEEKLLTQNALIKELNDRIEGIKILSGVECDIMPDGSLDYPDSVLEQLDFVIASIHSRFKSSREECTSRLVRAMENPFVTIIGHPTGRIIGRRDPLPLDFEIVFEIAHKTKTALEINCYPDRLDLRDTLVREAKMQNVLLALGTDAHSVQDLKYMELGVGTARRGWAEPENVLNTFDF